MVRILRPRLRLLHAACVASALAGAVWAQGTGPLRTGHAIGGFHGLESGLRPPVGMSYDNLTLIYTANSERDRNGNNTGNKGSVLQLSNHTTATWRSPWRILGGNYVTRLRLSLANGAPNPNSLDEGASKLGLGDTYLEPFALYWPGKKGAISFHYGMWLDTGSFSVDSNDNTGKGFNSTQFSLGWTYYLTEERLWHYSLLTRYSFHGKMNELDLRPGDDVIVDWNVGRHVNERWNVGLAGYMVFQTSKDSGTDANDALGFYGTAALGIIGRYSMPGWGGSGYFRFYQEFNSFNHTEGQLAVVGVNFTL